MRKLFLVLFALNVASIRAQPVADKDSLIPNYSFSRLHGFVSIGKFMRVSGNTYSKLKKEYPSGINDSNGTFYGSSAMVQKNYSSGLGLAIRIHRLIDIGFTTLPYLEKTYYGGNGINASSIDPFFGFNYSYPVTGKKILERIGFKSYMAFSDVVLVPYTRKKKIGFELTGGIAFIYSKIDVLTNVVIYRDRKDTTFISKENLKTSGGIFSLTASMYFGKFFSVFYQVNAGISTKARIAEKTFNFEDQEAHIPEHYEHFYGLGHQFGIALHFLTLQKNKKLGF